MTEQPSTTLRPNQLPKPYRVIYSLLFRIAPLPDDPLALPRIEDLIKLADWPANGGVRWKKI